MTPNSCLPTGNTNRKCFQRKMNTFFVIWTYFRLILGVFVLSRVPPENDHDEVVHRDCTLQQPNVYTANCSPTVCEVIGEGVGAKHQLKCSIQNYKKNNPNACEDINKRLRPCREELPVDDKPCLPKLTGINLYKSYCEAIGASEISLNFTFQLPICDLTSASQAVKADFSADCNSDKNNHYCKTPICRVFNYTDNDFHTWLNYSAPIQVWYDCMAIGFDGGLPETYFAFNLTDFPSGAQLNYNLVFKEVGTDSMRLIAAAWLSQRAIHLVFQPIRGIEQYKVNAASGQNVFFNKEVSSSTVEITGIHSSYNIVKVTVTPNDKLECEKRGFLCTPVSVTLHDKNSLCLPLAPIPLEEESEKGWIEPTAVSICSFGTLVLLVCSVKIIYNRSVQSVLGVSWLQPNEEAKVKKLLQKHKLNLSLLHQHDKTSIKMIRKTKIILIFVPPQNHHVDGLQLKLIEHILQNEQLWNKIWVVSLDQQRLLLQDLVCQHPDFRDYRYNEFLNFMKGRTLYLHSENCMQFIKDLILRKSKDHNETEVKRPNPEMLPPDVEDMINGMSDLSVSSRTLSELGRSARPMIRNLPSKDGQTFSTCSSVDSSVPSDFLPIIQVHTYIKSSVVRVDEEPDYAEPFDESFAGPAVEPRSLKSSHKPSSEFAIQQTADMQARIDAVGENKSRNAIISGRAVQTSNSVWGNHSQCPPIRNNLWMADGSRQHSAQVHQTSMPLSWFPPSTDNESTREASVYSPIRMLADVENQDLENTHSFNFLTPQDFDDIIPPISRIDPPDDSLADFAERNGIHAYHENGPQLLMSKSSLRSDQFAQADALSYDADQLGEPDGSERMDSLRASPISHGMFSESLEDEDESHQTYPKGIFSSRSPSLDYQLETPDRDVCEREGLVSDTFSSSEGEEEQQPLFLSAEDSILSGEQSGLEKFPEDSKSKNAHKGFGHRFLSGSAVNETYALMPRLLGKIDYFEAQLDASCNPLRGRGTTQDFNSEADAGSHDTSAVERERFIPTEDGFTDFPVHRPPDNHNCERGSEVVRKRLKLKSGQERSVCPTSNLPSFPVCGPPVIEQRYATDENKCSRIRFAGRVSDANITGKEHDQIGPGSFLTEQRDVPEHYAAKNGNERFPLSQTDGRRLSIQKDFQVCGPPEISRASYQQQVCGPPRALNDNGAPVVGQARGVHVNDRAHSALVNGHGEDAGDGRYYRPENSFAEPSNVQFPNQDEPYVVFQNAPAINFQPLVGNREPVQNAYYSDDEDSGFSNPPNSDYS